ncbi:hypothetical protein ACBR40_38000 [Nonomuraea sp. AD125B]
MSAMLRLGRYAAPCLSAAFAASGWTRARFLEQEPYPVTGGR